MIAEVTYWFLLTYLMPNGKSQKHLYSGYPSIAVCEAVMQREVEAALTLIHPYRLRGLMTGPCTPSKPMAG